MKNIRWWFAGIALISAWLLDALFWMSATGVNVLIWFAVILVGGFVLAAVNRVRPATASYFLAVVILLLAAVPLLRLEDMTRGLSFLLAIALLFPLASTFTGGGWWLLGIEDHLGGFFRTAGAALTRPLNLFRKQPAPQPVENAGENTAPAKKSGQGAAVLRGLLLALPIVVVLGALLASADPIFNDRLASIFVNFDVARLVEYGFRLAYILVLAYAFTGVYLHAILPDHLSTPTEPEKSFLKPFLGWIEALVVLVCVDLLFAVFVIIQFQYFFGGQAKITAAGYTYSEYAVRGFNELVTVAVLSLLLTLVLGRFTKRATVTQQRGFSAVATVLIALVLVMLVSAFQRLQLYEEAYGFTELRTYTHFFIPWLGALLVAAAGLEISRRSRFFAAALLACALGFVFTLAIINVDAFIVHQNVTRAMQGKDLDGAYFAELTMDAVPALVDELKRPDLPETAVNEINAELACRAAWLKEQPLTAWQSFTTSGDTARALLLAPDAPWAGVIVYKEYSEFKVKPNGEERYCSGYRYFD